MAPRVKDLIWMRNRLLFAVRAAVEQGIMGAELRDVPGKFSFRDSKEYIWDPPRPHPSSNRPVECPALPGLYSFRDLLNEDETSAIVNMAERVCGSRRTSAIEGATPIRSPTEWSWYKYETASRRVAPILADSYSGEGAAATSRSSCATRDVRELENFEVFGGVPPSSWLRLSALASSNDGEIRLGAHLLSHLAFNKLPSFGLEPLKEPSFMQLQTLERGTGIGPHIDAGTPRAEAVATLGLVASCHVRVGPVLLRVNAGDLYILTADARWSVKHEVLPPDLDRMSLTVRFNPFDDCAMQDGRQVQVQEGQKITGG